MTRRNKLIILIAYLVILVVALSIYTSWRLRAARRVTSEMASIEAEKKKIASTANELARLQRIFPSEPGTAAFIEQLYVCAREARLAGHEVSTPSSQNRQGARSTTSSAADLETYRIKITASGSYRNLAEYIRRVQNIDRFERFTDIRFTPGKQGVDAELALELFSMKGRNGR